ncbi:hypothetical protein ACN08Y_10095 [Rothia sp. P5764]|uniref:hypothetical protein n=1 Tax=Rothia sp. P5764 TaxID=3402654 RepID=UPI003ACC7BA2
MSDAKRFNQHIIKSKDPAGCWVWVGAISNDGYGIFWRKNPQTGKDQAVRAHRYALALVHGELGQDLHALHRCDNTLCVKATADEASHLILGNRAENMADRSRRGRSNFQIGATQSKEQRAEAARKLRLITLRKGYDQQAVNELMKGIPAGQLPLF